MLIERPQLTEAQIAALADHARTHGTHRRLLARFAGDAEARRLLGPAPKSPPPTRGPCRHEGPVVEWASCGSELLHVRDCDLHDRCTRGPSRIRSCRGCGDYRPAAPEPDPAALAARLESEPPFPLDGIPVPTLNLAHRLLLDRAAAAPPPRLAGEGRGVVMAVGGTLYFACAWVSVSLLRWLGCTLPVEWWHLGRSELDPRMAELAATLGVRCVDARAVAAALPRPPRTLNGWELKPFAVLHSRFREVLFMDADCLPVSDPTALFADPLYRRHGALFWPDLPPPDDRGPWIPPVVWETAGMSALTGARAFESGQFLVDRSRCARELAVTMHLNEHSDFWYRLVYGDKDTFCIGWRRCGTDYGMTDAPAGWAWPAIQQHDPAGRLAFQHVAQGKAELAAGERLPGIVHADACEDAARCLTAAGWSGRVWDWLDQSAEESRLAAKAAGEWRYDRVGFGARDMTLEPDGLIGRGAAGCEQRWTLRLLNGTPTLVITGAGHKGTMIGMIFLAESADGVWRGRWEAPARGPVEMRPLGRDAVLPWFWEARPGTWDRAVYDSVVHHDEYGLRPLDLDGAAILDVGAHIGSFAHHVRARGAAVVHCYEPDAGNRELLRRNAGVFGAAVYAEAVGVPGRGRLVPCAEPANTGGGCVAADPAGDVEVVGLDAMIERLVAVAGRVDLLKLDCEGAEFAALEHCTRLGDVGQVALEWHAADDAAADRLADILRAAGFARVSWRRTSPATGLMSARR